MKNNITNQSPRFSFFFYMMFSALFAITLLSSCDKEDDTPPVSAYVEPEPEPETPEEAEIVVPNFNTGIDFESHDPEFTFFGQKEGAISIAIIDNPVSEGINTSAKVVEVIQSPDIEPWAGFLFDLSEKIDFSVNRTVKIKVYSPAEGQDVNLKLEDIEDSTLNTETVATTTVANEWEELSFIFSPSDSDKYDRAILFFDFQGEKAEETTHYFDDIILVEGDGNTGGGGAEVPTVAAPTPLIAEADVISIFSDAYTNVADTDFNPNWGQATVVTQEEVAGNNTLKYETLNYQGTAFANAIDISGMTMLHIDYWTTDSTGFNGFLISTGPAETAHAFTVTTGEWVSVDIPLSEFTDVDLTDVIQMKFDGNGTIYLDNIYFHNGSAPLTAPATAASTPIVADADVISMFSDAYTDVSVDTFRTGWSDVTLEDVDIEGNAVKKYSALNFVGIEAATITIDATSMTHFHTDIWTADATELKIKLVDFGADGSFDGGDDVEHEITIETPTQGQWVSLDIPLSDFVGLTTKANIAQLIYVGAPSQANTIFMDNIYFHK